MIIEKEKRREVLLEAGVPDSFLSSIERPLNFQDLEYVAKPPEGFYFYLPPVVGNYKILNGYDVTPIYEGSNSDTFYVLLSSSKEKRFVYFSLEQDAIYIDFGSDFTYMLMDLLINYYEFATEISVDKLSEYGRKMGFENAEALFKALEQADEKNLRKSFELDAKWRKEMLPKLVAKNS